MPRRPGHMSIIAVRLGESGQFGRQQGLQEQVTIDSALGDIDGALDAAAMTAGEPELSDPEITRTGLGAVAMGQEAQEAAATGDNAE